MDLLLRKYVDLETAVAGADINSESEDFDKDRSGP
jgi:hypothetical protein